MLPPTSLLVIPHRFALIALLLATFVRGAHAEEKRYAFFVCGDPQFLAEDAKRPRKLDPYSDQAGKRFIKLLKELPGKKIPKAKGGGTVSREILGVVIAGDLIESLDKRGRNYPAMQRFEWKRFVADFGLRGGDGKIPFPVYELHGNHDGPQGDTFVVDQIIRRNKKRPGVVGVSANGLHYSWDWGPLHLVNVGMFVGEGEKRREGHHYAPRSSLEFLRKDLREHVGKSGRPVMISHHLHLGSSEYDWPKEDLSAYWDVVKEYNVVGIVNGHTHGSPPRRLRWDGKRIGPKVKGVDNFDPDDAAAARLKKGKAVGLAHGLLYVELLDSPGVGDDRMVVRSYATRDNWKKASWDQVWSKSVKVPDSPDEREPSDSGTAKGGGGSR